MIRTATQILHDERAQWLAERVAAGTRLELMRASLAKQEQLIGDCDEQIAELDQALARLTFEQPQVQASANTTTA